MRTSGTPSPHRTPPADGRNFSLLRTFVLVTVSVPIVIYGLMPQLHRARRALIGLGRR
jgi:hypothetical protein